MTDAEAAQRRKWLALALLATTQFVIVLDAVDRQRRHPVDRPATDFSPDNLSWSSTPTC